MPSFYCFEVELSPSWCWIFLLNQLALLLLCLNALKQWHQENIYIHVYICMMYIQHHPSPFCEGEQLSVQNFEKGGSEKGGVLGDLKSFCHAEYLPGGLALFLLKKKSFKDKIWLWVLNFKCWSWPVLAKESVDVWFCYILVLLNHLNKVTRIKMCL